MKVAKVKYTGRARRHTRRGPSDETYSWVRPTSNAGEQSPQEIHNIEDAIFFEEKEVFDVEWTATGKLAKRTEGPASEATAALQEMGYRQKQKVAKALGIKASGAEEELDERLEPEVERLQEQMEEL